MWHFVAQISIFQVHRFPLIQFPTTEPGQILGNFCEISVIGIFFPVKGHPDKNNHLQYTWSESIVVSDIC